VVIACLLADSQYESQILAATLKTGIGRAILSVPLHVGTALVMGVTMGHARYITGVEAKWYVCS